MKLISILIALSLERYLNLGSKLKRFDWFHQYVHFLHRTFKTESLWQGYLGLTVINLPILLIAWLVSFSLSGIAFGTMTLLFDVVVVLYCLGPNDLIHTVKDAIYTGEEEVLQEQATKAYATLVDNHRDLPPEKHTRALTNGILVKANESLFAALFWYLVFGGLGIILYRVSRLALSQAQQTDSVLEGVQSSARQLIHLLDWLPARLAAFAYALVGDFIHTFTLWLGGALKGLSSNCELLINCGNKALHLDEAAAKATPDENLNAVALVERSTIFFLVLIAIFTIGGLIY